MLEVPYIDKYFVHKLGYRWTFWFYRCIAVVIMVIILVATRSTVYLKMQPDRQFFERDPSLSYYNVNDYDTCDNSCLIGCSLGISLTINLVTSLFYFDSVKCNRFYDDKKEKESNYLSCSGGSGKKSLAWETWGAHQLGLGYAILSTVIATNILKVTVARPRPSFFYLCNYKGYYNAIHSGDYTAYYASTNPNNIGDYSSCLNFHVDLIASFPSGHASLSFACMTFSVLMLQKMWKISNGFTLWGMLTYSPLIVSAWIAVSRVHDFRHHEDEILAGAIIGVVCSLLAWRFTINSIAQLQESFSTADDDNDDDKAEFRKISTNDISSSVVATSEQRSANFVGPIIDSNP